MLPSIDEQKINGHLATREVLDDWTVRGLVPSLIGHEVICHRADVVDEHGDSQALCRITSARWQEADDLDPIAEKALYFTAQAVENARLGVSWWDVTSDGEKRSIWVHYSTGENTRRAVEVKDDRQTIASLRRQIEQQIACDTNTTFSGDVAGLLRLRLRCHGSDLDASETVSSSGLDAGDVIDVTPENSVHRIVSSSWFENLVLLVIAANAVTIIFSAQHPEDVGWQQVETAFTIGFIAELVLKWVGYGVERYFRDRWNLLDFLIVVEGLLSLMFLSGNEYDVGLSALRVVRTLRPLRAALHLPELQVIVRSLLGALPRILSTLKVCALFMLVFSIAGVQWFNGKYRNQCEYRELNSSSDAEWSTTDSVSHLCGYRECPEILGFESRCGKSSLNPNADITSFDNIGLSALTLFQSITLEGWVEIMNFGQDTVHGATWPFFVVTVLFGNFVLVNLLMGVIITEYDIMHDESENAHNAREEIAKDTKNLWLMMEREQQQAKIQSTKEAHVIEDKVKWGRAMLDYVDQGMCIVILINVMCLCVDRHDPYLGPQDFSDPVNDIVTVIFVVEMIVKVPSMAYLAHCDRHCTIKALGFQKRTHRSFWAAFAYFNDPLNIIDAGVVALGLIELAVSKDIGATAVFRGFRVLRLVKLSTHIKSMQEVCATISKAGSSILYVALLLSMFIFIFAVAGMQIFAGKLKDENGILPRNNFDTFHWAIVSTFQVLAGENWPALMYDGVRASFSMSVIFYITWLLVGQFVTANLFTAVVFSHFEDLDRFGCPADWRSNPAFQKHVQEWWDEVAGNEETEATLGRLFDDYEHLQCLTAKDKDYLRLVILRMALHSGQTELEPREVKVTKAQFHAFFGENDQVEQGVPRDVKVYRRNAELLEQVADIKRRKSRGRRSSCTGNSSDSKSLCCFSRSGIFRKKCESIVTHTLFENAILGVILLSTIGLILSGPKTSLELQTVLDFLDKVVLLIFILEACLKVVAHGLIAGSGAYLLNSWNVLDFTAVVVSVLGIILDKTSVYGRVMRILRVFRALRLVSHAQGMRVILIALTRSMGKVFDVAVIVCFAFLLFALLGVSFFKGGFYRCNDPNFPPGAHKDGSTVATAGPCSDDTLFVNLESTDPYVSETSLLGRTVYLLTEQGDWVHASLTEDMLTENQRRVQQNAVLPVANATSGYDVDYFRVEPRQWATPPLNFDNVGEALLAMVVFASGEGWPDAMFNACDMAGLDRQPIRDASPAHAYYFIAVAAMFSFFLMDLFVGAIYATFLMLQKEGEEAGTGAEILLTDAQREWKDAQKSLQPKHMRPPLLLPKPDCSGPPVSWLIHRLVTIDPREEDVAWRVPNQPRYFGKQFEICVQLAIMLNTLVMSATWHGESQEWTNTRQSLNTVFSLCFLIEAILKLIGFGPAGYFQDSWNRFDFLLTIGSLMDAFLVSFVNVAVFRSLRIFRVARLLRLMHGRTGVITLLNTLWLSIPALLNVAALLALLFTFYAVLGVSVFGELPRGDDLTEYSNFETWGGAMMTLLRISTGEDWQNLMYACYPCWLGSGFAILYFVSFVFLAMFILLNMFVMIICDNMDEMDNNGYYDEDNELLKLQFEKLWVEYHVVGASPGDSPNQNLKVDHRCLALLSDSVNSNQIHSYQSRGLRAFLKDLFALDAVTYGELKEQDLGQTVGRGQDGQHQEMQRLGQQPGSHNRYWYQTRHGGKVSVCGSQLERLEQDKIIDDFTIIAENSDQQSQDGGREDARDFSPYTIPLGAKQQKLREYLKVVTTDASTEHQIAAALQLHVLHADEATGTDSERAASGGYKPELGRGQPLTGSGFVVMFSDLLAALSCLLTEEKLTEKLIEERPAKPNWTAEDWIASELGDMQMEQGTTHKKAMARQLQSAEQMRQKVGRGLVSQTRARTDRVHRALDQVNFGNSNVAAIEWDPETRVSGKTGP